MKKQDFWYSVQWFQRKGDFQPLKFRSPAQIETPGNTSLDKVSHCFSQNCTQNENNKCQVVSVIFFLFSQPLNFLKKPFKIVKAVKNIEKLNPLI